MARFQRFAHQRADWEPGATRAEIPHQVLVATLRMVDVRAAFRVVTLGRLVDGHHDPVGRDLWDIGLPLLQHPWQPEDHQFAACVLSVHHPVDFVTVDERADHRVHLTVGVEVVPAHLHQPGAQPKLLMRLDLLGVGHAGATGHTEVRHHDDVELPDTVGSVALQPHGFGGQEGTGGCGKLDKRRLLLPVPLPEARLVFPARAHLVAVVPE